MIRKTIVWVLLPFFGVLYAQDLVGKRFFKVPGASMEPAIRRGEQVVVNELAYKTALPERGDIIAYQSPADAKVILLKRVIALPFETVELRHKSVYINGQRLGEGYVTHSDPTDYTGTKKPEPFRSRDAFGPLKLAMNEYFVLGDNRDQSSDSRFQGPIPRRLIIGRAERVLRSNGLRELH